MLLCIENSLKLLSRFKLLLVYVVSESINIKRCRQIPTTLSSGIWFLKGWFEVEGLAGESAGTYNPGTIGGLQIRPGTVRIPRWIGCR